MTDFEPYKWQSILQGLTFCGFSLISEFEELLDHLLAERFSKHMIRFLTEVDLFFQQFQFY